MIVNQHFDLFVLILSDLSQFIESICQLVLIHELYAPHLLFCGIKSVLLLNL